MVNVRWPKIWLITPPLRQHHIILYRAISTMLVSVLPPHSILRSLVLLCLSNHPTSPPRCFFAQRLKSGTMGVNPTLSLNPGSWYRYELNSNLSMKPAVSKTLTQSALHASYDHLSYPTQLAAQNTLSLWLGSKYAMWYRYINIISPYRSSTQALFSLWVGEFVVLLSKLKTLPESKPLWARQLNYPTLLSIWRTSRISRTIFHHPLLSLFS